MERHESITPADLAAIKESPALLSALYDMDLLPEQIQSPRAALMFRCAMIGYQVGKSETQTKETTE